jgi:serine/threonine protein kinase
MSKTIDIDTSSCLYSGIGDCVTAKPPRKIEIASKAFSRGAQGEVYPIRSFGGSRQANMVAKLYFSGFPAGLPDMMHAIRGSSALEQVRTAAALQSLPSILFRGHLHGKPVHGAVMARAPGQPFSEVLDESGFDGYLRVPLVNRLKLCHQFAEGMSLFYGLTMVHADLNCQNLMVDLKRPAITIIDPDGGFVARAGGMPSVLGKFEPGWMAPEIREAIVQKKKGIAPVGVWTDGWAVAVGIHYLLFGISPFFFLEDSRSIRRYLSVCRWPEIRSVSGVSFRNHQAHAAYLQHMAKVSQLHGLFQAAFQHGYHQPRRRPNATSWIFRVDAEIRDISGRPNKKPFRNRVRHRVITKETPQPAWLPKRPLNQEFKALKRLLAVLGIGAILSMLLSPLSVPQHSGSNLSPTIHIERLTASEFVLP